MNGVLSGQTALITGGSRGIGRAVVRRLARDGAAVAFSYRTREHLADQLVAELTEAGAWACAIRVDLADPAAVRGLFAAAEERLGGLDVLVNNAGETLVASITDSTEEDFDRLMAVNVKAAFFLIQEAARRMRRGGRIVNISSTNTVLHAPGIALYAASKAALEQFTLVAARELSLRRITVNTVSPGPVDTDMLRASQPVEALDMAAAMTPLRRLGQPADVADVVAFLVGPDARWLTGQNLRAAGGLA
ncbi:glucose 1-dehydrogenase [Plantactinospora sp. B6F1]|uniref:glucose 1-dehydrogenase n=1 Tax=Plantactinospora sp. B6F1 TaxID=3158971 RepID=UPI0032D972D9